MNMKNGLPGIGQTSWVQEFYSITTISYEIEPLKSYLYVASSLADDHRYNRHRLRHMRKLHKLPGMGRSQ